MTCERQIIGLRAWVTEIEFEAERTTALDRRAERGDVSVIVVVVQMAQVHAQPQRNSLGVATQNRLFVRRAADQLFDQFECTFEVGRQAVIPRRVFELRQQPQTEATAHVVAGFLVRKNFAHSAFQTICARQGTQSRQLEDRVLR